MRCGRLIAQPGSTLGDGDIANSWIPCTDLKGNASPFSFNIPAGIDTIEKFEVLIGDTDPSVIAKLDVSKGTAYQCVVKGLPANVAEQCYVEAAGELEAPVIQGN